MPLTMGRIIPPSLIPGSNRSGRRLTRRRDFCEKWKLTKSKQIQWPVIAPSDDPNYKRRGYTANARLWALERPMPDFTHRTIDTNGIRMHIAECGAGPLVLLCHGFPESWYSWRHQLPAMATEGYHAVAPDLRGYGQTDRPESLEAYDIFQLTGDLVGLVNAIGTGPAIIAGHDWGAWIAANVALLRPDLFRAVALLSVPYVPRRAINQTQWEAQQYPGKIFYQAMLRSPMAEQYFEVNPRAVLLSALWAGSGDAPPEARWKPVRHPND